MTSLIFTKSNTCLSRGIRWLSNEPVSHMAIVFDTKLVFHSNLYGTRPEWLCTFIKKNEVVFRIDFDFTLEQEEAIYQQIPQYDAKGYDVLALLYIMYRGLLYRFFKIPIPQTNRFGQKDQFLCTELAKIVNPDLKQLDMTTPYQIYLEIKSHG